MEVTEEMEELVEMVQREVLHMLELREDLVV
jgi:hypothetical protein